MRPGIHHVPDQNAGFVPFSLAVEFHQELIGFSLNNLRCLDERFNIHRDLIKKAFHLREHLRDAKIGSFLEMERFGRVIVPFRIIDRRPHMSGREIFLQQRKIAHAGEPSFGGKNCTVPGIIELRFAVIARAPDVRFRRNIVLFISIFTCHDS